MKSHLRTRFLLLNHFGIDALATCFWSWNCTAHGDVAAVPMLNFAPEIVSGALLMMRGDGVCTA